jgi:hypothetical protein
MRQKNPAPNFLGMTGGGDRTGCVALVKSPAILPTILPAILSAILSATLPICCPEVPPGRGLQGIQVTSTF